jgi:hypothetical protein
MARYRLPFQQEDDEGVKDTDVVLWFNQQSCIAS